MAKTPYVPYSDLFEDLFTFCGVTVPTLADFGGTQGWVESDFQTALGLARTYLNNNYPEDEDDPLVETYESYYAMMKNYTVNYWSTEWHYLN